MSSRFNPSTPPRTPPAWCKPGFFGPAPPIIAGRVQYVIAYLMWKDITGPDQANLATAITLPWNDAMGEYYATSPGHQHGLTGRVTPDDDQGNYTLQVGIWRTVGVDEDYEWPNVHLGIDLPWDSLLHEQIVHPGLDERAMQIWA